MKLTRNASKTAGSPALWIETLTRHLVLLALAGIVLRYLYPVSRPYASVAVYLCGWVAVARVDAGRRRIVALLVVTAGVPLVFYLLARLLAISGVLQTMATVESHLVLVAYSLAPAAILGTLVWQWDSWCRRSTLGRALFTPLVALAATGLFWSQAELRRGILGHPTAYAIFAFAVLIALVVHAMVRSSLRMSSARHAVASSGVDATKRPFRPRAALPALVLLLLTTGLLTVLYRGWQRDAVSASGGLMRPTAFRFDFADYLSLETEIGLSRELVLLYREDRMPPGRLIRRYVLSGYSPRRGFFRLEQDNEPSPAPPLTLTSFGRSEYGLVPVPGAREEVSQEYYVVNFDPDAFMAIPEPRRVEQLEVWDRSSFNGAYRVHSLSPVRFINSFLEQAPWPPTYDRRWEQTYVGSDIPEAVAQLAREVTAGIDGYYDSVVALRDYLQNEYYYSLSPGIAVDNDQLGHFLFVSRKGYCSYFAFSMTLMARSLGIPARVAVGFFVDPSTGMLGFYPVRGDMAHAWVEVYFEGHGWIAFDPTSQTIAPGEVVSTDYGIDQEQLSGLIEEILSQGRLAIREDSPEASLGTHIAAAARRAAARWYLVPILVVAGWIAVRALRWRRLCRRQPHAAALLLFSRARRLVDPDRRVDPYITNESRLVESGALAAALRYGRSVVPDAVARMRRAFRSDFDRISVERPRWRRVVILIRSIFPPRVPRSRRAYRAPRAAAIVALSVCLFAPDPVAANPAFLEEEISDALDSENYERAIRRIEDAAEQYPSDPRFPLIAGDLYFDQSLYHLAEEEYRRALALGADPQSTRHALADTLARSNQDEEAIRVLQRMLASEPERRDVIADVSWLYFKTHRLEQARALLEETIETSGSGTDLSMTLATVYSGLWDYEAARREYMTAITHAEEQDNRLFLAVAYYNLSILNAKFYRWEDALLSAERSLEYADRSSGYLIRGEYHEQRLRWAYAARDYEQAQASDDSTPLPQLSQAILWTEAGYPDRAIMQLHQILEEDNRTWIYNYGTDPVRFDAQVHAALADAYRAGAHRDTLFRPGNFLARTGRRLRAVYRRARAGYHRGIERRLIVEIADAYAREGQDLMESWHRMLAAESIRPTALRHVRSARAFETAVNPAADLDYRFLEADLERDVPELAALRIELQDQWERPLLLETLVSTVERRPALLDSLAADLYAIAPGSFLIHGIRIPIALQIDEDAFSRRLVARELRRLGFAVADEAPMVLELSVLQGGMEYALRDRENDFFLRGGNVRFSPGDLSPAILEIAEALTTVGGINVGAATTPSG